MRETTDERNSQMTYAVRMSVGDSQIASSRIGICILNYPKLN